MNTIKKHPIAFTLLIGWEIFSIAGVLSVKDGVDENWYGLVGLMVIISAAVFIAGIIAWIISAICRRKKGKNADNAKKASDNLARQYMMNVRAKSVYWIFALLMLPIIPMLLIDVLGYYMAGVFFMTLGIMVWIVRFSIEIIINRFYITQKADSYFSFESGESDELLDSFYGDCVHVYRGENWKGSKPEFITSLLKWEGSLGKTVKCYRVSNEFLSQKYGYEYNKHFDDLILIPFSQFDLNEKNGETLLRYFDRLSLIQYTDLVNTKYQKKKSLEPSEYACTDEKVSLYPVGAKPLSIAENSGDILMAIDSACDETYPWKKYYNCLLVMKNAVLTSGKIIEGDIYIESFKLNEKEKELYITVINVPEEDLEEYSDEEFFDGISTTLCYRYEKLQWYWDGFCDCEKTAKLFEKISQK